VEAWVAEAARRLPANMALKVKLSALWIRQGRLEKAEALCRQVLETRPDDTEAMNNLAWLLAMRGQGKAAEALELMNRAIKIQGEAPSLSDTRAVARISLGEVDQAVKDLVAVRKQAPGRPGYALHLAWAYQAKGQSEQARLQFQDAERLGLKPRSLDPLELAIYRRLRKELSPG